MRLGVFAAFALGLIIANPASAATLLFDPTADPLAVGAGPSPFNPSDQALLSALTDTGGLWSAGPQGHAGGDADLSLITVPEPLSWTMMIAGFGMAGAMFRRRRGALAAA